MSCSCGNTSCPCGIPCYCSEELCKCPDCAIGLPGFCKVCNKLLITDIQRDEETCLCFIGESTSLIHDNPQYRSGNLPIPIGQFVSGKLVVNVMIPIPVVRYPYFVPHQPPSSMSAVPPFADHSKISLVSDMNNVKPFLHPLENLPFPTIMSHSFLKKSSETLDYDLNSPGVNCEQNPGTFYKFGHPPGFLKSKETILAANTVQKTKYKSEDNSNFAKTAFYLPSVIIDNISFPVKMMDPIWRLPTPNVCTPGSSNSTLNLKNPFYMGEPGSSRATIENDFSESVPDPSSENSGVQCFSNNLNGNIQPKSFISSSINEKNLNPSILLEKLNLDIDDKNAKVAVSSNNSAGVECSAHPENVNPIKSSKQYGISEKFSNTGKSEQFRVCSTSESRENSSKHASPVICNAEHRGPGNVVQESSGEMWQNVPLSEIPVFTHSNPPSQNDSSKLQQFFDLNSQNNEHFQRGRSEFSSTNDDRNHENIPLYIDSSTTQKMERYLNF